MAWKWGYIYIYVCMYEWSRDRNPLHYLLHVLWGHEVKGLIKGKDNDITCIVTWHKEIIVESTCIAISIGWKNVFPDYRQLQLGFCYLPFINRLLEFVLVWTIVCFIRILLSVFLLFFLMSTLYFIFYTFYIFLVLFYWGRHVCYLFTC